MRKMFSKKQIENIADSVVDIALEELTIPVTKIDSGNAEAGKVMKTDGEGGAEWRDINVIENVTLTDDDSFTITNENLVKNNLPNVILAVPDKMPQASHSFTYCHYASRVTDTNFYSRYFIGIASTKSLTNIEYSKIIILRYNFETHVGDYIAVGFDELIKSSLGNYVAKDNFVGGTIYNSNDDYPKFYLQFRFNYSIENYDPDDYVTIENVATMSNTSDAGSGFYGLLSGYVVLTENSAPLPIVDYTYDSTEGTLTFNYHNGTNWTTISVSDDTYETELMWRSTMS